ncbi:MAG: DUF87 domain-containing protein [Lachnospiraceae bacterium]|nr:DUF87 domain-containing protein [Lachnospiraceae bacterium]
MGIIKNNVKEQIKPNDFLVSMPKSAQQTLEIKRVGPGGIFEHNAGIYSKTYLFKDINYEMFSDEEKGDVLSPYISFLSSLTARTKITIVNRKLNSQEVDEHTLYPLKNDGYDEIRNMCNQHIRTKQAEGNEGLEQKKYITFTTERPDYNAAKSHLNTIEAGLRRDFMALEAEVRALSSDERLELLYDFYNPDEEKRYLLSIDEYIKNNRDFKNDIVPVKGIEFNDEYVKIGDNYKKAAFISFFPSSLTDLFFQELCNYRANAIITVDIIPIDKHDALDLLEDKYLEVEKKIEKQQETRNRRKNFTSDISKKVQDEKKAILDEIDQINIKNQNFFYGGITIVISATGKEEMEHTFKELRDLCDRHRCKLSCYYGAQEQRAAMNTALPLGVMQVDYLRSFLTSDIAAFQPFHAQDIKEKKEFCVVGINQISKRIISINQKVLVNGNGFVFGVSGAGKSSFIKWYITSLLVNTDDDIIIFDPKNEYHVITDMFDGTNIIFSNRKDNRLNPWEVDLEELRNGNTSKIITDKYELMMAIAENAYRGSIDQIQDSILSRCIKKVYEDLANSDDDRQIIWNDIYEELKMQPEPEAEKLVSSFELFVTGILNKFNAETNVDMTNRLIVYGIDDLGERLENITMVIILEHMSQQVMKNFKAGKATRLVVDEFQEFLNKPFTADYMEKCYAKFRSYGGFVLGITQNIVNLLKMYSFSTMLSNSEFEIILKQSEMDAGEICNYIHGFTPAMMKYCFNCPPGTGIIRYGNYIAPFDNVMSESNPLYNVFDTNMWHK